MYPVRPLKQSLLEFQRFSYKPDVLENLLSKNAATVFKMKL